MEAPQKLSVAEIRKYMIGNGCKVTNHALVKHFKKYLTHPQTQNEARKQFKTYVNILATIKNENNQKYLILRKKYLNECPSEDAVERAVRAASSESTPGSPSSGSIISEASLVSPFRQPPPYKPPPEVGASPKPNSNAPSPVTTGAAIHHENVESYRQCINEFAAAVNRIDPRRLARQQSAEEETRSNATPKPDAKETVVERRSVSQNTSRANSIDEQSNKENIPRFSFSSGASGESSLGDKVSSSEGDIAENPISVKEATRKFNRMASEEEAKVLSPSSKKKPEKQLFEEKDVPEVTLAHPKAKEWIVSMAKANYQELAKLANDFPELVKLQDPSTGYTALHWAAKHGNEDVVKLIAGTYKADVNARTNGGYTPLHLAMQFGRSNIFELLCNSYKANRDLMDWSGNKPLDYSKQRTTVSASTYSSEYDDDFYNCELNSNSTYGGLFNLLTGSSVGGGGGGGSVAIGGTIGSALTRGKKRSNLRYATLSASAGDSPLMRTQSLMTSSPRRPKKHPAKSMQVAPNDDLVSSGILFGNAPTSSTPTSKSVSKKSKSGAMKLTSPDSTLSGSDRSSESIASPLRGGDAVLSPKDNSVPRRKQSFLRKTLLAAVTATKPNTETKVVVTNKTLME